MKHQPHKLEPQAEANPKLQDGNVEYVAPKSEMIRAYADSICEALATRTDDPVFRQPHVVRGLAQFLELALRAKAKYLNDRGLIDKPEK